MILKKKIPKEFYKLFRTKNRDAYMQFLVAIYEENNEVYTALGLTIEECRVIIADTIAKARIIWEDEEIEEEDEPDILISGRFAVRHIEYLDSVGMVKKRF